ncbi:MAG: MATE family efflux transporter [Lachnobacterium sp.]|nr:MATE family efflux transporter [Lachnobacterium sp.]
MKSEVNLTEGSIAKNIIKFAIPMFIGNLFQQLYNVADSLVVGNFLGSDALAAVTSTGSLIFLLVGFFNGTAMGAGVIIARFFGAKDHENVKKAIHTDLAFGILCGAIMTLVGVIFAPQILTLMDTPEDVFVQSVLYIRIYFLGSIAVVLYNVCMGIMQAVGDSRHPLYYLVFSSVVNILLDLLFNGVFKLGVEYAALATIISQLLATLMCLWRLTGKSQTYRVELRKIGFDKDLLKQIVGIGLPSGLQNSIISIANVVVQANINAFGSAAMAGCGAYFKIEGFVFLPITCFSMALTTFIGQNLGAKQYDRAKKGAAFGIFCSITLAEVIGILVYFFMPRLILLFNAEADVVNYGILQAHTESLFYFLLAFSHIVAGIMRGAGKSTVPMFVMLGCWCIFRITYVTIITSIIPTIQVVFWAYPITWSLSSVVFLIYLLKADWIHNFDRQEDRRRKINARRNGL